MNNEERYAAIQNRLAEENGSDEQCFWMSFCDTEKPEGSQFLGVVIVTAMGVAHAIDKSHRLGINPGGEVKIIKLDDDDDDILPEHFNRLLSKQELVDAGYIDEVET